MDEPNPSTNGWYLVKWNSREACLKVTGYEASQSLWMVMYFRSDMAFRSGCGFTRDEIYKGEDVCANIQASLYLDEDVLTDEALKALAATVYNEHNWQGYMGQPYQEWEGNVD